MKAVILAAGQGTRLWPMTRDRPKSMIPVGGRPVIEHTLLQLARIGIKEVVIVVSHGADALQSQVGDGGRFGLTIEYVNQGRTLGPGHAVSCAADHVEGDFLVIPADTWCDEPVMAALAEHEGCASVQLASGDDRHGRPVLKAGRIVGLSLDAPVAPLAGAHRLDGRIFHALEANGHGLRDALASIMREDGFHLVQTTAQTCIDLVDVSSVLALHSILIDRVEAKVEGTVDDGAFVEGDVYIGPGARIRAGTIVRGPAHIGAHCDIGPSSVIEPGVSIGEGARIEPFCLLTRCSIGNNIRLRSHGRIQDALVDDGVSMGAHIMIGPHAMVGADAEIHSSARVGTQGRVGVAAKVMEGRHVTEVPDGGVAV